MLSFPTHCAMCGGKWFMMHECSNQHATLPPCAVCGISAAKHGSYPTCSSHPYAASGREVETKFYEDGTTATGTAPLPENSPMPLSSKEKQDAYRARQAMLGHTEVRGIYLPPALHQALKDYARKLLEKPPQTP